MWMPRRKPPPGSSSAEIASSKSRAVSPSMVTMQSRVRSRRVRHSPSWIAATARSDSSTDSLVNVAGNAPLARHDLHVDARVAGEADELDDLGLGEAVLVGPGGDAGVDVDAVGGVHVLAVGDAQEGVDLRVVGDDDGAVGAAGDPPDDGLAPPHEDLRDGAGLGRAAEAAPRPRLLDEHEDEVAVEGRARPAPHDGEVRDAPLAREEPRPPLAPDGDAAGREVRVLDEGELLAAGADDEALALEGFDLGAEGVEGGFVGRGAEELLRELAEGEDAPPTRREGREDAACRGSQGSQGSRCPFGAPRRGRPPPHEARRSGAKGGTRTPTAC